MLVQSAVCNCIRAEFRPLSAENDIIMGEALIHVNDDYGIDEPNVFRRTNFSFSIVTIVWCETLVVSELRNIETFIHDMSREKKQRQLQQDQDSCQSIVVQYSQPVLR